MNHRQNLGILLVVLALLAAACGGGEESAPADGGGDGGDDTASGGSVVIALSADPATLDPHLLDDGSQRTVNNNIYESLLTRNAETGELEPLLATDLPEQVDETTWRFTLREGVEFTNGEPFNADAVVATVERILDPEYASEQLQFYGNIDGAEKVDDYTVDITTSALDPVVPARMAFMRIGPPEYMQEEEFATNPIGTGPYTFVSRTPGEEVVLTANPDYWDGAPEITDVTIRVLEDESTQLAALQAGEVDLVINISPDLVDEVPQLLSVPGAENSNVRLNAQEEDVITADPRVRLALNMAVDREAIAESLYAGYATPLSCSTIPPAAFGHNPDLEPIPYDPDQARQLLEEAGVAGETLTFVSTPGRWSKDREVSEFVASSWEEVGLNVDLEFLEWESYLDAIFAEQNKPPALYHSSTNDLLDADRQITSYYDSTSELAAYRNERVDELAEEARQEPDVEQREALYAELTEIACEDAAFVYLVNADDTYGATERLQWTPRADQQILVKDMSLGE